MSHLNSINIEKYRGLTGCELSELKQVNLITGANGIGKTTILEALWLLSGRYNPNLFFSPIIQRSTRPLENPLKAISKDGAVKISGTENSADCSLKAIFNENPAILLDNRTQKMISDITGQNPASRQILGELRVTVDGKNAVSQDIDKNPFSFNMSPLGVVSVSCPVAEEKRYGSTILKSEGEFLSDEFIQKFSDFVEQGNKTAFIEALGLVSPLIEDIEILTDRAGQIYFSAKLDNNTRRPLQDLGGGIIKLARLFLGCPLSEKALLLVDEIEIGLHHSVLSRVWENIYKWTQKWDVQLVATTHSYESIVAAITAFKGNPDNLAIHHLEKNEADKIVAATFTGEALLGVEHFNLEVR